VIDKIINEPVGGAHRDHRAIAQSVRKSLQEALKQIAGLSTGELIERRFDRLMSYGRYKEQAVQ
jgi:acetyl-CoA carboxylase carboxyl transferase subunit alpha